VILFQLSAWYMIRYLIVVVLCPTSFRIATNRRITLYCFQCMYWSSRSVFKERS